MRPPDNEPPEQDIEALVTDEERRLLDDPETPEDAKVEIAARLERFEEVDTEEARGDGR
jgi:hypothetical protein